MGPYHRGPCARVTWRPFLTGGSKFYLEEVTLMSVIAVTFSPQADSRPVGG